MTKSQHLFKDLSPQQVVKHVHFHVIPKPSESDEEGLVIGWPQKEVSKDDLEKLHSEMLEKLKPRL